MNATVQSKLCELTENIYVKNSIMRTVLIIELIASVTAILGNSLLLLAIVFNKTLHFNIRLLLICFCGAFVITNIGTFLDSLYYLIAVFLKSNAERCPFLLFAKYDCIALRNVYYLGFTVLVVSTLFLSIERIIATLLYRTYEQNTRRWIAVLMAFLQWFLVIPLLYYHDRDAGFIFPYCAFELFNPRTMMNIHFGLIVIQISSLAIIVVLWMHNNKKFLCKKSQHESISARYQLRENVSTTKLMVPVVATVTVLVISGALLYIILLPSQKTNDYWIIVDQLIVYCLYSEIEACFTPLAAVMLVIVLCRTNRTIRRSLFHVLGLEHCISAGGKNSISTTPDEFIRHAYFDQLQRQWSHLPKSWKNTTYNCPEYAGYLDIKSNKYQYIE